MYVHLGGECTVSDKFIIGIFDFDKTIDQNSATQRFLRQAELDDRVEIISPDIPRSFIVTLDRIYITPISAATLRKRLQRSRLVFDADD